MSDSTGIKINKKRGYTVVFNDQLPEGKVSARAWGVYVYLLSRPDGWECRVSHLRSVFTEGRDAIYTTLKELAEIGLMGKETYLDKGMKRSRYVLNADSSGPVENGQTRRSAPDTGFQDPGNPDTGSQDAGSSDPEKPGQVIKDLPTTDTDSKEEPFRDSLRSPAAGEQQPLIDAPTATDGASETRTIGAEKAPHDLADEVADWWWNSLEPKPLKTTGKPFIAIRNVCRAAATAGWTQRQVADALQAINKPMPTMAEVDQTLRAMRDGTYVPRGGARTTNVHQMPTSHPDVQKRRAALGG